MFPNEKFVRTMIQRSHRHKYYCVEHPKIMSALSNLRMTNVIEEHPPRQKTFEKRYQPKKKGWRF